MSLHFCSKALYLVCVVLQTVNCVPFTVQTGQDASDSSPVLGDMTKMTLRLRLTSMRSSSLVSFGEDCGEV